MPLSNDPFDQNNLMTKSGFHGNFNIRILIFIHTRFFRTRLII